MNALILTPILFVLLLISTSSLAQLSEARYGLSAETNGNRVLFAGGAGIATVDVYDSDTGIWSVKSLALARYRMGSASFNGRTLFAGGGVPITSYVDAYDGGATDNWVAVTALGQARSHIGTVVASGRAYFAGGTVDSATPVYSNRIDIYDFASSGWLVAKQLSEMRTSVAVGTAGSKVLFAGGQTTSGISGTVDIYDFVADTWDTYTISPARKAMAACSLGSKVFFAGGETSTDVASAAVDIYDATGGSWSTATLTQARMQFSAVAVPSANQCLFISGLINSAQFTPSVEVYDGATQNWFSGQVSLTTPRALYGAALIGSRVIIGGGEIAGGGVTANVEFIDCSSGSCLPAAPTTTPSATTVVAPATTVAATATTTVAATTLDPSATSSAATTVAAPTTTLDTSSLAPTSASTTTVPVPVATTHAPEVSLELSVDVRPSEPIAVTASSARTDKTARFTLKLSLEEVQSSTGSGPSVQTIDILSVDSGQVSIETPLDKAYSSLTRISHMHLSNGALLNMSIWNFVRDGVISMGSTQIPVAANTLKQSVSIESWPWTNAGSVLRVLFSVATDNIANTTTSGPRLEHNLANGGKIRVITQLTGAVDDRDTVFTFDPLQQAILVPRFTKSALVDPSFQVLFPEGEQVDGSGKKKNTKVPIIAGCVAGGVVLLALALIAAFYLFRSRGSTRLVYGGYAGQNIADNS